MNIKPIKSQSDYDDAVTRIEEIFDATAHTAEADELMVLTALVEQFETERFAIEAPSPVEAIRFRMEQQGLTAKDLEPFLGTRSRVSEVLSGTRSLSIDMIRALHEHLSIPAESLIGKADDDESASLPVAAARLLTSLKLAVKAEGLQALLTRAFGADVAKVTYRKTRTSRTNAKTDQTSLDAWCAVAALKSENCHLDAKFEQSKLDEQFLRHIATLSASPDGPTLVQSELAAMGIAFVVLPHLPNTYLDGAAMFRKDNVPLIALTLRRDRVDNFWFTLLHELAHIQCRHLDENKRIIVDDLELKSEDDIEDEADSVARDALIPPAVWNDFKAGKFCSLEDVKEASARAAISPAVVAGRWQRENKDFRKFSKLLGHNTIRSQFADFVQN